MQHLIPVRLGLVLLMIVGGLAAARPVAAQPGPGVSAPIPRELVGIVIRDPWYDFGTHPLYPNQPNYIALERMGALLEQAGVRWVRLEFFIEGGDAEAFERNISRYDYFITQVAPRHNLKVLGLLSTGLLRDVPPLNTDYGIMAPLDAQNIAPYGSFTNPYMRIWLDRALAISARYKTAVHAYEILNEHNRLIGGGGAGIPASLAASLHTKYYRLLRTPAADEQPGETWRSAIPVLIGGLHPAGTGEPGEPGYVSDVAYLRGYYQSAAFVGYASANGGRFPAEGLAYHPYPEEIRPRLAAIGAELSEIDERMDEMRAALVDLGQPELPFWITEIGHDAAFPGQSAESQAAFLRGVFGLLAGRGDVAVAFWFKYEDFPGSRFSPNRWGIVRIPFTNDPSVPGGARYQQNGTPAELRPAFFAMREIAGLPNYTLRLPLVQR